MKNLVFIVVSLVLVLTACNETAEKGQTSAQNQATNVEGKTAVKKASVDVERWAATDYRNKNWQIEMGKYYFSEMWTWAYQNELLPQDDLKHKGTMSVYLDPPTGTLLLTRNDTRYTDEMTDFVLLHPDGQYTIGTSDEHGKKRLDHKEMTSFPEYAFQVEQQKEAFQKYVSSTGISRVFAKNKYNNPTIKASQHQLKYAKTTGKTELYLAELPFSIRALYLVSKLSDDMQLPINMEYAYLLGENQLVVSESHQENGKNISYYLQSISPSEYFLDLNDYPYR